MFESPLLTQRLKELFEGTHLSRIKFIVNFIEALIAKQTVNLSILALCFCQKATLESAYRRLQRFFEQVYFDDQILARVLAGLVGDEKHVLIMDRTNWKFGKQNINFLMLSVAFQGVAIPLFWMILRDKRGNSDTEERIFLMKRYLKAFGSDRIEYFLADREFIGHEWLTFLIENDIGFYIRIRNNSLGQVEETSFHLRWFFKSSQQWCLRNVTVEGCAVNVAGKRFNLDEQLLIVTNRDPKRAAVFYKQRWEVERLFSCLKSKGFDLEHTHMTEASKLETLMGLLALTLSWCVIAGEEKDKQEPIKVKSHGRKRCSLFRLGLDYLNLLIIHQHRRFEEFKKFVLIWTNKLNAFET